MVAKNTNHFLEIQSGFQAKVFSCKADVAIIGGAMGAGKSYSIILDIMKHVSDPKFQAGVFRKSRSTIIRAGGLWNELLGAAHKAKLRVKTNKQSLQMWFPSGALVEFAHTNHPNFAEHIKGAQYTAIFIDEGSEFDEEDFLIMMSRMRSTSKISPFMRMTLNPVSNGWQKDLIRSYLNKEEYPDVSQCGQLKYLYYIDSKPIIRASKAAFAEEFSLSPKDMHHLKTFTFIAGTVEENVRLLSNNPGYIAHLQSLPEHERNRYRWGWWGETPRDGMFRERDFYSYGSLPKRIDKFVVFIDTAQKTKSTSDYTVASCFAIVKHNVYLVDMLRGKWKYRVMRAQVEAFLELNDYVNTCYIETIHAGDLLFDDLKNTESAILKGMQFRSVLRSSRESKVGRAERCIANMQTVKVHLPLENQKLRRLFLQEVCSFSADLTHAHDDICDTFFDVVNHVGKRSRTSTGEPKPAIAAPHFESFNTLRTPYGIY